MIVSEKISKYYSDYPAVSSISFEILREHGITALLGPNGAGKTTCMRLLTGFLMPTSGVVRIDGQELNDESKREIAAKIGYLPETTPLYPEMLVEEYLRYVGQVHGVHKSHISARMSEMIDAMELSSHLYAPIGALSKGFRQRVGLAGTLIHRPKYIILDEPTSGLDPNQIAGIRSLIKKLGKQFTLIISTHILQEVEELCDRAIIIHRGAVVADQRISSLRKGKTIRLIADGTDVQEVLNKIEGVKSCNIVGYEKNDKMFTRKLANAFSVYSIEYSDKPEILFHELAKGGYLNKWKLRGYQTLSRSLEEIFMELTKSDISQNSITSSKN